MKGELQLQSRDIDFLRGLYESRILTIYQAASFFFAGKKEAAKKRIQRLKAAHFINQRCRRPTEPAILSLSKHGFDILKKQAELPYSDSVSWPQFTKRAHVSDATLSHELGVLDAKAAIHSAISNDVRLQLVEFSTWPTRHAFTLNTGRAQRTVRPDGFIRIEAQGSEHHFFLEVDRSTESLSILLSRAEAYRHYYRNGAYAQRNGYPRESWYLCPFRVLMVCLSAERRNNIAEKLLALSVPIRRQVWLTTRREILSDPLGPIWVIPSAYRDAIPQLPYRHVRQGGLTRSDGHSINAAEIDLVKLSLFS